jgi:ligand-binding sensor domain-containing protein
MRTFYLFILLLIGQCSSAQLFSNISTFTTQNGLSNNTITCIQKDEEGFLWVGTHEGLNRYDGTEFINVLSNAKNNLPSNNITKICFINKTLLVVGTDAGLCLLNIATLTGKKIELPFNPRFSNTGYYIEDILYNKSSNELWICTWHGLFVLNTEGKLLQKMMGVDADMGKGFFSRRLIRDDHNGIYFYSQQKNSFFYPDFSKQELIPVEKKFAGFELNDFMKQGFALRSIRSLDQEFLCIISRTNATDDDQYLWYYNSTTKRHFFDKLTINIPGEKRLSDAYRFNDSIFLLNSYFGEPFLYNSNSHEIKKAADRPLWFTSWPDGYGAILYRDGDNSWIGTSKALLQSSAITSFFKTNTALVNTINSNQALVSYNYGILNNNKLWVACLGAGLYSVDTNSNNVQSLHNELANPVFRKKTISTAVLSAGESLWLFSLYGPVQVNADTRKLSPVAGINKDPLFDETAFTPIKDNKGNIWATIPNGITRYDVSNNLFTNFKTTYQGGNFPALRGGPKTADANDNIWIVRQDTLIKYDATTQEFSFTVIMKDGKSVRSITSIASDGGDLLYMSVAGAFGIYSISSHNIDLFTKQTGIISTAINDIVSDNNGNAWMATEGGLIFYNKQKKKFSSFTMADGLPDDNITGINFSDAEKKILFLGFAKTYCLVKPQYFFTSKTVPKNIITRVEVDGSPLSLAEKQTLSYTQNSISFTYTGINYNQGQQNNYACMLEGFDQDWKYPGIERKVNYINLPPGDYTFKVKSANHQGEWNEQPAIFLFEIRPPFWQRWWFRILIACLIISAIYYFIKRREAALQKENTIKLQMSELRMQALRSQMNPHFIFNSLNSIQSYILSNNTLDAAGYLSKFAKLMRRILDQSKHNFLPLGEVLETLKLYVEIEAFRFNNEFSYTFSLEENDELMETKIPPMLLQPFVENAILHGLMPKKGDKKLLINCSIRNNTCEIIIDDNGIGRTQHQPKAGHTSQGEKLTMGMLESFQQLQHTKASLEIIDKKENDIPAGTRVILLLPLN